MSYINIHFQYANMHAQYPNMHTQYAMHIQYIIVQAQHTNMHAQNANMTCTHKMPTCITQYINMRYACATCRYAGTVCMREVRAHDSHLAQPKDQSSWI